MIESAISVSMSGGNHNALGARPKADAISVMECAMVKDVMIRMSGRHRRNGITRQRMNSRWSVPSRICRNPSSTNRNAAWYQRGSSLISPGLP